MSLLRSPSSFRNSQLSDNSHVEVTVTFNDPVVFAGQSLVAVITFRNTQQPPESAPLNTYSTTSNQQSPSSSNLLTTSGHIPDLRLASSEKPDLSTTQFTNSSDNNSNAPSFAPLPSASSIARSTRPAPIDTNINSERGQNDAQEPQSGSTSTTQNSITSTPVQINLSPNTETDSPALVLTEPTSPDNNDNTTQLTLMAITESTPDDGIPMASKDTIKSLDHSPQFSNTGSSSNGKQENTEPTEKPKQEGSWSWDIPGRRLSSQIANTVRELYFNNNTSSPEVQNNDPASFNRGDGSGQARTGSSPLSVGMGQINRLQRSGSQSITRPTTRRHIGSGSTSFLHDRRSNSGLAPDYGKAVPQSLLMGYAQVQGYYVLEDELIDVSEFDHVKTQGVVVGSSGNIGYGSSQGSGLLSGLASGLGSLFQLREPPKSSSSSPMGESGQSPNLTGVSNTPSGLNSPDRLTRKQSWGRGQSTARRLGNVGTATTFGSTVSEDAIPLFSTPQSLLFVDLKLAPGESKTFYYKLQLPKDLPPSCRAKSIRIYYNLIIGTQKSCSTSISPSSLGPFGNESLSQGRPQPKTIFVPFRVFPFVDPYGQQYTHDLKTPIVVKKDTAAVIQLSSDLEPNSIALSPESQSNLENVTAKSAIFAYFSQMEKRQRLLQNVEQADQKTSFDDYVQNVLVQIDSQSNFKGHKHEDSQNASSAMRRRSIIVPLTPSVLQTPGVPLFSSLDDSQFAAEDTATQENIEHFTRFQQVAPSEKPLKTRFDIGQSGKRIATVTISKAVYRVGDNVIFTVDFHSALLKCFHVTASLETEENISGAILKDNNKDDQSENEANRTVDTTGLTRRIYSQATLPTYSITKSAFEFTIPATASPQFSTSDISLRWVLKLDFITNPPNVPPLRFEDPASEQSSDNEVPLAFEAPSSSRLDSTRERSGTVDTQHSNKISDPEEEALNATVPNRSEREADEVMFQQKSQRQEQSKPSSSSREEHEDHDSQHRDQIAQSSTLSSTLSSYQPTIDPFDLPEDPQSVLEIVHLSDKGLIAVAKETVSCALFHCKIPLTVVPTNQDISALLQHSIAPTRSFRF